MSILVHPDLLLYFFLLCAESVTPTWLEVIHFISKDFLPMIWLHVTRHSPCCPLTTKMFIVMVFQRHYTTFRLIPARTPGFKTPNGSLIFYPCSLFLALGLFFSRRVLQTCLGSSAVLEPDLHFELSGTNQSLILLFKFLDTLDCTVCLQDSPYGTLLMGLCRMMMMIGNYCVGFHFISSSQITSLATYPWTHYSHCCRQKEPK